MFDRAPIVFVGPGVMAEAMASSLMARGGLKPEQVIMSGPRRQKLEALHDRLAVRTSEDNRQAVGSAGVVVLTVKPQTLQEVLADLAGAVPSDVLVLSIVAGATIKTLADGLQHSAIVRAMPNTPGQVGAGITVWTATDSVNQQHRAQTKAILAALGQQIEVGHEDYLDMATALSGTGPAYVYLFMEAMIDAGVHMGFPRRIAEQLVVETILGSIAYYQASPSHPARLRNQVTSPGGTSAEALYFLEKAGFRSALARAVWAAYERSVQLGEGKRRSAD